MATDEDIQQFRAAVAGVVTSGGPDALPAPDPEWRAHWSALVDLGVAALCVPEAHGGLGLQVEAAAGTAAELGAALHGSPYAGLVAGTHASASASASASGSGGDARGAGVLAGVLAGGHICAYGRLDASGSVARAVDGAPVADALVLEDPSTGDLVLLDDPASWSPTGGPPAFDVSRSCADLTVDVTAGHRLTADPTAAHLFGLLLAADALGGTERALARTVAYARDRKAFGRPIGGFQAVQHRLVDHADGTTAIEHEDVRATLADALVRVEEVKLIVRDTVERILDDAEHPSDGPVAKLAYTELDVALTETALDLIASSVSLDEGGAEVADRWHHNFLWGRALTISGGASEIMRGLVGRQLLGLPRA